MATAVVIEVNPMSKKLADLLLLLLHEGPALLLCAANAEADLALARAVSPAPVLTDVPAS